MFKRCNWNGILNLWYFKESLVSIKNFSNVFLFNTITQNACYLITIVLPIFVILDKLRRHCTLIKTLSMNNSEINTVWVCLSACILTKGEVILKVT